MRVAPRVVFVLVAGFASAAALAQVSPPGRITDKTPDKIVSPTPTPAPRQPKEYVPPGPQELPPTPTQAPTRTPTPTPAPPDSQLAGPRWGTDQATLPISIHRLDNRTQCKSGGDFLNGGRFSIFVDCVNQGYGPLGLKADFEIWKGLRLKNGWKVKSLQVNSALGTEPANPDSHHGFNVSKSPAVGSDNPETTIHLFAEGFKEIRVEGGLTIEGPHGTTPW
jgi:hypothetical protein